MIGKIGNVDVCFSKTFNRSLPRLSVFEKRKAG